MGNRKINIFALVTNTLISLVFAQTNELDAARNVSSSLNQFAVKFLAETADQVGDTFNLALSPYTVWSLMTIIAEGARGNTARQLESVLQVPPLETKDPFRRNYKTLTNNLLQQSYGAELDVKSAMFTTQEERLNPTYREIAKNVYDVDVIPTDFKNLVQAVNSINAYVASATKNKIQNFVKIDDIIDAEILAVSTLYFKGKWKSPFDSASTFIDTFHDENGNPKGQVKMMHQVGSFPYSKLPELNSHAVELPYGNGDRFSMIVILPLKGKSLSSVLKEMANLPGNYVLDSLANAERKFGETDVEVFLPRFTINSELNLNTVLENMGIKDVFNLDKADLLGMFSQYLYISRVIQQAKIEVNEEGTVASAAAGGAFLNKTPPPKFNANRDFAYFIVDKPTRSIFFAGKVTNPSAICDACGKS